jgi:hypothetical protein
MKRLFLLLLIITSLYSYAQESSKKTNKAAILQETTEPIKGKSNRIIFHFNDTSGLFSSLSKILTDKGYDLEVKDRETGVIKTKTRDMPGGWAFSIQMRALFRDSTVTFSATQPKDFSWDIFYLSGKGTTFNKIWNEILAIGEEMKPLRVGFLYVK